MTDMEAKARELVVGFFESYNVDDHTDSTDELVEAILRFGTEAHNAGMEEAAKVVRQKCTACRGTGYGSPPDDAMNPYECEYCGRPIAAIREKIKGDDDA